MTTNLTSAELDEERKRKQAYEYLCHLEEAKLYLENALNQSFGLSCDLENKLRTGIILALLATKIAPEKFTEKKIYDIDLRRFEEKGLHFKHTDNINMFLQACQHVGLPKIFIPETLDLYDGKNTPKVIFCIHALAHYLAKKGILPLISNLYGQVQFGEHEISKIQKQLEKSGMKMPAFSKIGGMLAGELTEDDVAIHAAVMLINEALDKKDAKVFMERLEAPLLNFLRVRGKNSSSYLESMAKRKQEKVDNFNLKQKECSTEEDVYDKILTRSEIQDTITKNNIDRNLIEINECLSSGNTSSLSDHFTDDFGSMGLVGSRTQKYADYTIEYYKNKDLGVEDIKTIIAHVNEVQKKVETLNSLCTDLNDKLTKDKAELGNFLKSMPKTFGDFSTYHDFVFDYLNDVKSKTGINNSNVENVITIASLLCLINDCLDKNDDKNLVNHLKDSHLGLSDVDPAISINYLNALKDKREAKNSPLWYDDVVSCVAIVNQKVTDEQNKFDIVTKINEGLGKISKEELLALLVDPKGSFKNVIPENISGYYSGLLAKDDVLWHNHVQETIDNYNKIMSDLRHSIGITDTINQKLIKDEKDINLDSITGIIPEIHEKYYDALKKVLSARDLNSWSGWTDYEVYNSGTKSSQIVYFNHKSNEFEFNAQTYDSGYLNPKQISEICNRVGSDYNRELYFLSHIEHILNLQSLHRTLTIYRKFHQHLDFVNVQLPNVTILQCFKRTLETRRAYLKRLKFFEEHSEETLDIKLFCKSVLKNAYMRTKFSHYNKNLEQLVGLESLLRTFIAQNDYYNLINMTCPSLKQIYKYLHLLESDDYDVVEEREVLRLKNLVYDKINESTDLEEEVKSRYLLIGVLINNRQSLKDLETESNKSKKKKTKSTDVATISKEKVELFEKYGHVFYILQHKSEYLSRLLLRIAAGHSTKFMREYFLTIFNFGTTSRDEYLMLRALRMCLDFEVNNYISSIQELTKDDPAAFKIAISFWRDIKAPTFLQQMLAEPINNIMKIKGSINVNPVDVYKVWIQKVESETGKLTELPYDVEPEVALKHEEVQIQMKKNVEIVIQLAKDLRDSILSKYDYIPYGIRYFAKCVYEILNSRFESAPEEEKMKIVANLLYYRFINPPTVSPEAFNLLKDKTEVTSEERRNLAQISSILQRASALVLSESSHEILQPLDDFTKDSAVKFMQFFKKCIDVDSLESHYNINQFSDRTQFLTPELKLPFSFIIETHKMLIEHADLLFPHEDDVLQNIIKEIGDVPELTSLVDYRPSKSEKSIETVENIEEILGNAMTILPLVPPKVLLETEENKNEELLNNTINKLIDILRYSYCETISQVLVSNFTPEQEKSYQELLAKRESILEQRAPELHENLALDESQKPLTLSKTLETVIEEIKNLIELNIIKADNDYQDLLLAVVKKIVQRTQYVKSRKNEITRFRSTYDDLQTKIVNLTKQLDYYNLYIKGCVTNMAQRKKSKKKSVKKSAAKLIQQGILVEIEGINPEKYKNVSVIISTTDEPGVYEIAGEFIGISTDTYKCRVNFQDLLQLRFDNVAVLRIMNIVKVRVNLLIRFINLTFHV